MIDRLKDRSIARSHATWERLGRPLADQETPSNIYARLRMEMLDAEREVVIRARDDGTAPGEVLSAALAAIDVEESLLDRHEELESLERDRALAPRPREETLRAPARWRRPGSRTRRRRARTAWSRGRRGCTCAPA